MKNTKEFKEFIQNIQITPEQEEAAKNGHKNLRSRLLADDNLKPSIITTFLQGSYKRSTIVKPEGENKVDVDLVVVTNFSDKLPPRKVLGFFEPFVEKHYPGKWKRQGRSIGIKLRNVELDLVITATPPENLIAEMAGLDSDFGPLHGATNNNLATEQHSTLDSLFASDYSSYLGDENLIKKGLFLRDVQKKIENWRKNPLIIPDRDANEWRDTNPIAQIEWTKVKNAKTNGHFLNVVKTIKWWKSHAVGLPKYPKSYPLEHMAGDCCPDDTKSLAEAFVWTLYNMIETYKPLINKFEKPFLEDRGCVGVDVISRVTFDDFAAFIGGIEKVYPLALKAYQSKDASESTELWHQILGENFPVEDSKGNKKSTVSSPALLSSSSMAPAFTPRDEPSDPSTGRFS